MGSRIKDWLVKGLIGHLGFLMSPDQHQANGMARMIEILTIPREERARRLSRYYGAFWFPGDE